MAESNSPRIVISLWVLSVLSLLFIALRLYCKGRLTARTLGTDDVFLCVAWTFSLIYAALLTESVRFGMGKHSVNISAADRGSMLKYLFIGEFFALISIPTSKTSFAITLLRLTTRKWQRYSIWFIILSMNAALWTCAILLLIQCKPVSKNWNASTPGYCWKARVQDDYAVFAGTYSALLDVILACFPEPWDLVSPNTVTLVYCLKTDRTSAGVTAAMKTSFVPGVNNWKDPIFSLHNLLIWTHAETSVTIVASCIPFYRVLIRRATCRGTTQSYQLESYRPKKQAFVQHCESIDEMSDTSILRDAVQGGAIVKMENSG
ncbi:hypothetical protein EJ04DRAFT_434510 [Polyplosphaeria fusca]|uniref:Rhodopsin domain-containing protein n=1 Tax=Polyplosphaeria fusca TaxID=682080 RepID=A0A9P4R282_9PLEO|nr:hypothetical protein EJ04DRAFT_434510 [Polyplosphaeria fusca]